MVDQVLSCLVPGLPLIGFLAVGLNNKRLGNRTASFIACLAVFLAFVAAVILFGRLLSGGDALTAIEFRLFTWIPVGDFNVSFSLLTDRLSSIFMLIITGVGFLIHLYSIGYMHDDPGYNRFFSYLNLFVFFMLILVMGSNYLLMFAGWEGVGLCSYLLIGFWFKNDAYNAAANKAFIMNRIGDLGMLIGIVLILANFGSLDYTAVLGNATTVSAGLLTLITLMLFIGAMGKSAQLPLYTWLPDAMAGPTPVSALIHAATMVTAGIYMVVRNNILFSLAPLTPEFILIIGLATSLLSATIALTQNDIKKVLAYSTVSQLGLIFAALGMGAYSSGIFHMGTHAFFKALLFLGAGSVIHALHGEQDIRNMGGLRKKLPITFLTFLIAVLAISGIPPFSGFFSKDEILAAAFAYHPVVWVLSLLISLLTATYMFRLLFLVFYGKGRATEAQMNQAHEAPATMSVPLVLLAICSALAGVLGIPAVFAEDAHWLSGYLNPVLEQSTNLQEVHHADHSTELLIMAGVVALILFVIILTYRAFVSKEKIPVPDEMMKPGLKRLVYRKYLVDEIYDALVVKPLYILSGIFESFVEKAGIDGLVNSGGRLSVLAGMKIRQVQKGNIGFYIFMMVIGTALMFVLIRIF